VAAYELLGFTPQATLFRRFAALMSARAMLISGERAQQKLAAPSFWASPVQINHGHRVGASMLAVSNAAGMRPSDWWETSSALALLFACMLREGRIFFGSLRICPN
jgi:hypothetical protein